MDFKEWPLVPLWSINDLNIAAALKSIHSTAKEQLQLLIVILPEERGNYGKIKRVCETKLGLVSQCCLPKNVKTDTNIKYLENIALKINVKTYRQSFLVLMLAIPHQGCTRHLLQEWLDQSTGQKSPHIELISAQLERQEIIGGLFHSTRDPKGCLKPDGMIRELMMNFYQRNRRKPERIIFYRDGISESQFSQVIIHEVDAIRKACLSLQEDYLPPITLVIVQKRHHTRIFPHTLCSNYTEQVAQIPSETQWF
ncbi:Os02g0616400 [Oryza sativa Japonica Group]|uniref:Os02g0616400 protein n=1 Tax=Oryza sativa subsp. japonica TaxID=39947 RepID=Q0DZI9_ORYSJ|nr:Os02g0616400 [Oryza sativa Japonica Group]|eukprot:NP_001047435.2 Os02g0616400 [Oryza sativa Japonica Group]